MARDVVTPVIVGAGDFVNRSTKLEDAQEPLELMLRAIQAAVEDTTLANTAAKALQRQIDSIDVVATWTWPYEDLPGLLSSRLGVSPRHQLYSEYHGGNQPGKMFDEAARRISKGEATVAVVTGGEALASLSAFAAAKQMPPPKWTKVKGSVESVFKPDLERMAKTMGAPHRVGLPIQVYPLYENAYRAKNGQSLQQNMQESAKLYADFAKVAKDVPAAWNFGKPAETEQSISTVTKRNRMICYPYPLLMNAFNTINLAGACILTSTANARALGIPESQWIYPLGGAGTSDSKEFWLRPSFDYSPCISQSLDAGLTASGLHKDDIDVYDFYSCFPIVPKLACAHLGMSALSPGKPITLLGGLTSFGGAGNNYSMHAIVEMTRRFRRDRRSKPNQRLNGLVLANGGTVTYQHVVCLSTHPRTDGSPYPSRAPLPETSQNVTIPEVVDNVGSGWHEAVIETYTVDYARDNTPALGHLVVRLAGRGSPRTIANHGDDGTLEQLVGSREVIGRKGWVRREVEERRNLFSFERHDTTRASL